MRNNFYPWLFSTLKIILVQVFILTAFLEAVIFPAGGRPRVYLLNIKYASIPLNENVTYRSPLLFVVSAENDTKATLPPSPWSNTSRGGIFLFLFMQIYLTWGSSTWPWPQVASFYSVSFFYSCMYRNTDHWLLLVRRKLPHWFSLKIHVTETERRAQIRPTCSILNNRSQLNLRPTTGQAEPIAQYFFEKSTTGC